VIFESIIHSLENGKKTFQRWIRMLLLFSLNGTLLPASFYVDVNKIDVMDFSWCYSINMLWRWSCENMRRGS